jgi:outer membrane protein assembly factor BamD (BamD/ComL family)
MKQFKKGVIVMFLAMVCFVFGCATTSNDWEKAQGMNTVKAYQIFLSQHPQSEFNSEAERRIVELRKEQLDSSLAELIVRMAPPTMININSTTKQIIPTNWDAESSQESLMPTLVELLHKGADPNAKRIKGYFPASNYSSKDSTSTYMFAFVIFPRFNGH